MPQPFFEDMGRKARWFHEIRGTTDDERLDRLRDEALVQVDIMRAALVDRLDPGRGPIDRPAVLVGAGRRARVAAADSLPGDAEHGFVTAPVEIHSKQEDLGVTLKQKLRRGVQKSFDPVTARMFRFDPERETWDLVEASGWNATDRYVWGHVARPGIYAAVALPKDPDELRRIGLELLARRTIRNAVATGHFSNVSDFADRDMFRDWFVEANDLDEDHTTDKNAVELAMKAHRQVIRELGRSWETEPFVGNPQWAILDDIIVRLPDVAEHLDLARMIPFLPFFAKVANRVGPWFPLGPTNVNGRVKSLAIHPTNSNVLYAGAANGGVWRSTNGGDWWTTKWKFEESLAIGAVATAPSNGDVVYAATGEDTPQYGPSYGGVGIFRSSNGGSSWSVIGSAADVGRRCNKVVVHPANSSLVYVASNSGVHRGRPGAVAGTWHWQRLLDNRATDLVIKHDDPDVMFAGIHNSGVWKSVNGGDDWERIEGDRVLVFAIILAFREAFPTGNDAGWIKLAIGRSGENGSDFLVAKLGENSGTTLISVDGGDDWLKSPGSVGVEYDEWCSMAAIHPRQNRHMYLASVGMQHSFDGWNFNNSPGTHSDHHQMVFHHSDDDTAHVCCDGGVYRTTDNGSSWHLRSDHLTATQLMSLGVSHAGDLVIGSATQDQGIIQTNGSSSWVNHGGGNEWGMFVVDPNDSRNIFISPGRGDLRRSTDGGVTYTNPTSGLTDFWAAQNRTTPPASFAHVAVKPGDTSTVVGLASVTDEVKDDAGTVTASYRRDRIYYSSNGGVAWSGVRTLPHRGSRVAFAPSDPTRVYAATTEGRVYRSDASGSDDWTEPASVANRPPAGYITSIAVDPFNRNRVYITYGSINPHIHRSVDGGATWAPCNGANPAMTLPDIALLDMVIDTENPDVLYAGSDIGVFRSNDRGSTWYWANDSFGERDLPRVPVTGLELYPGDHRLYASTMGRGLYYTQATGIVAMRATHVRLRHEWPEPSGIISLRLTDGSRTWTMTRREVIRRIQAGTEVYTIGPAGTRARVRARPADSQHPQEYLSTAPDETTANNLLSLPRFYG